MASDLANILTALTERLLALAAQDEPLRAQLRQLAEAILHATEAPSQTVVANSEGITPAATVAAPVEIIPPVGTGKSTAEQPPRPESPKRDTAPSEPPAPLPELTLGRSPSINAETTPSRTTRWISASDEDLPWIESRCRLKAKAARWAVTRRRLITEGAAFAIAIDPVDRDLISDAKALPECFLWMCHPTGPTPSDTRLYESVAACFVAVADLLAIMRQIREEPDLLQSQFEPALNLLAEAQSALRVAIGQLEGPMDTDQLLVFNWLKTTTAENQIFIEHYMRADDPADPAQHVALAARIERLGAVVQTTRGRVKQRRKFLGKVRHKASLIANAPNNSEEHWLLLAAIVDELVLDGLPPSNRELRELLLPVIDDLPELPQLPHGFQLVLSEIDRFLAQSPPTAIVSVAQPSPAVQQVKQLLAGRSLILIGGDRRPASYQALCESFGLGELIWIETREHQSIEGFESYIARPDVAAVLLAIRWSSHSFGEVRAFCDRHNKPLVRLPAGYSANQVAAQILAQGSERLRIGQCFFHTRSELKVT